MLPAMFEHIVIVGAGQAADQALHTLRRKGFAGKLTWWARSRGCPISGRRCRRNFSPAASIVSACVFRPERFYVEHSIDTRLGRRVEEIERIARRIRLDDGSLLPYDALLLATGSRPRSLTARRGRSGRSALIANDRRRRADPGR